MPPETLRRDPKKESEPQVVSLKKGSMIWPEYGKRGVLTADVLARKLDHKVQRLPGFKSLCPFSTFLDGRTDNHPFGSSFGTHSNSIKK